MASTFPSLTDLKQAILAWSPASVSLPEDLVARFGGIPLLRDKNRVITDPVQVQLPLPRKKLIHRLRTRKCELCGQHGTVAVHQVAKLARLGRPGPGQPAWAALMARNRPLTPV